MLHDRQEEAMLTRFSFVLLLSLLGCAKTNPSVTPGQREWGTVEIERGRAASSPPEEALNLQDDQRIRLRRALADCDKELEVARTTLRQAQRKIAEFLRTATHDHDDFAAAVDSAEAAWFRVQELEIQRQRILQAGLDYRQRGHLLLLDNYVGSEAGFDARLARD